MKKIIVVRLENVLVKKFNAEKSFEMMVKRMVKKEKNVEDLMKGYEEKMGKEWKEKKMKEMEDEYEKGFEKKEIYVEGKRVLVDLLGLKKMNESLGDMRIVVVSEMGGKKVKKLLNNNELDEKEIVVKRYKEGEIGDCLEEMRVMKDNYGKVVVLSNSDKDILECKELGIKFKMCGWGKVDGMESKDIFEVIGLRKG
jgi:hypothetical protein